MAVLYCPECGQMLLEGKPFCVNCGARRPDGHLLSITGRRAAVAAQQDLRGSSGRGWVVAGRICTGLAALLAVVYYPLQFDHPGAIAFNTFLNPWAWAGLVFAGIAQAKGGGFRTGDGASSMEFLSMLALLGVSVAIGAALNMVVNAG